MLEEEKYKEHEDSWTYDAFAGGYMLVSNIILKKKEEERKQTVGPVHGK